MDIKGKVESRTNRNDYRWIEVTARTLALLVPLVVVTSGCASSIQTGHQSALGSEPHPYRSYAFAGHSVGKEQAIDELIVSQLHSAMQREGFSRARLSDADLIVNYKVLVASVTERTVDPNNGAPGPTDTMAGAGLGLNGEFGMEGIDTAPDSAEKTLVVTLQDAKTYRIVWLGWSRTDFYPSELREKTQLALNEFLPSLPRATR